MNNKLINNIRSLLNKNFSYVKINNGLNFHNINKNYNYMNSDFVENNSWSDY